MTTDTSTNSGHPPDGQGWARRIVGAAGALWLPPVEAASPVQFGDRTAVHVESDRRERTPRPWNSWPANVRAAIGGTGVVLLACWTVSFDAIVAAAQAASIPFLFALLCPVIVDGEMAIGTLVLVSIARRVRVWTRAYLGALILASVAVSMAANMAGPYTRTHLLDAPWSYLAAGVPSLWIALVVHQLVILWRHRDRRERTGAASTVQAPASTATVERVPDSWIGVRSADGQWWWDGEQWRPVGPPIVVVDRPPADGAQGRQRGPSASSEEALPLVREHRPPASGDRSSIEAMRERQAVLSTWLREQAADGRDLADITVSEASAKTGIARPTIVRWLAGAPLSTFRLEPVMSGQEAVA